jgi:hypothetical protein
MCTVTFHPDARGFRLAMNRDEKRTRPIAGPPSVRRAGHRSAAFPTDPAGGTWTGINDARAAFALLNWYYAPTLPIPLPRTRGIVVTRLLETASPADAHRMVGELPLAHLQPFRVLGFFPATRESIEWRWDGARIESIRHPWVPRQWASSGFDEPTASRARNQVFEHRLADPDAGGILWLRRLHASHAPERGAFSTCVHRDDASTVSYTEIECRPAGSVLRYLQGSPCMHGEYVRTEIPAERSARSDAVPALFDRH